MIKINHIINLHDARFAAAENVDFISFALAKGNFKKIALTTYQDIIQWIAGTLIVADFENDSTSLMDFLEKQIPFDFLQVHESIWQHVPNGLHSRTIVFTKDISSAQNFLQQGFIVESVWDINHEKHFRLINCHIPKEKNKNFSLDHSFFMESYELDFELFNNWNQNFF